MPNTARLAFLGDLMLGRGTSDALRRQSPEWFWGDVLPMLRGCDAVLANLESPLTAAGERWWKTWKFFHFRADPAAARILQAGNVRFVCLANNHMLDYGAAGLLDTLATLDCAGIVHAGAGRDLAEATSGRLLEAGGLRLGLLAATDGMPEFAAGAARPGTNHVAFRDDGPGLDWVETQAAILRAAGAALVVLSLHWGPNMRRRPSDRFRRFAHGAIARGVDIIHGHSAHVVQAVERHGRGLILYDTGNFIDDYWKFPFRRTVTSFVFTLDLEGGRPRALRLAPVRLHPWPVSLAQGEARRAIIGNMVGLSAALGTRLTETADGLEAVLDGE